MNYMEQVAEITVSYKTKVKAADRPKISRSDDAHKLLFGIWDKDIIEYQECLYLLLLNKANAVLGYKLISIGGMSGTVVDVKQILAVALKCNAAGIIMAHNHPSSNLQPSDADMQLTRKVKSACDCLDLALLDHLIISPEGAYYSFSDNGQI